MMQSPPSDGTNPEPVLTAFLQRYLADAMANRVRTLAEYLDELPGYESAIASEFSRLSGADATVAQSGTPLFALDPGALVGPYRLERPLGRGAYGVVWLAKDKRLGRHVALKILQRMGLGDGEALSRFRREAESASSLDHPGICTVYEMGQTGELAYIALRYVEGRTLANVLALERPKFESGPDEPTLLARAHLIERAALAVAYSHERRILHRDLKPSNIMVNAEGEPVILDFGLARPLDASTLTRPWEVLGTLPYMSPEQLTDPTSADARADVWSLGVTLFECVTGERPFHAANSKAFLAQILSEEVRDPRSVNPRVPRDLAVIVLTALDRDLKRRYASARALAEDLGRFRRNDAISARPSGTWAKLRRFAIRRPALATLLALSAILLPALTGLLSYTLAREPEVRAAREQDRLNRVQKHVVQGYAKLGTFRVREALTSFTEALALDSSSLEARIGWLTGLRRSDRLPEALAWMDQHPRLEAELPCTREFRLHSVGQVTVDGDPLAGLPDPRHPMEAWILCARLLKSDEIGDTPRNRRALEFANRAIFLARTASPIYHYQRAEAAGRLQDAFAARDSAQALTTLWPDDAASYFYAGFASFGAQDYGPAIAMLQQASKLAPTWGLARSTLAAAYADNHQLDLAAAEFEALIAAGADENPAWAAYGDILYRRNEFAKAAEQYQKAIDQDPTWTSARSRLLDALVKADDLPRALAAAKSAVLATASKDPEYLLTYAQLLADSGDLEEARSLLTTAQSLTTSLSPPNPDLTRRIAATLRALRE